MVVFVGDVVFLYFPLGLVFALGSLFAWASAKSGDKFLRGEKLFFFGLLPLLAVIFLCGAAGLHMFTDDPRDPMCPELFFASLFFTPRVMWVAASNTPALMGSVLAGVPVALVAMQSVLARVFACSVYGDCHSICQ